MNIKNIIFDYGGVILNIDPSLTGEYLAKHGFEDIGKLHLKIIEKDLYNKFETGDISPQEFVTGLKDMMDNSISKENILNAWNVLLLDMPEERIKLLEKIKGNYRIFMLSNTNAIHYDKYRSVLEEKYGYKQFDDLFEKAYLSHNIGYRKPDLRIFEHVIKDAGINPSETLFIDDSFENVEAAEKAGLIGLHLREGIEITDLFYEKELLVGL